MKAREFYNKVSGAYEDRFRSGAMQLCRKKEREFFERYARGRILDLGCGTGCWTGRCFAGLDTSEAMLRIARTRSKNLMLGDTHTLPIKNKSFDSILLFFSVLRKGDIRHAIPEMNRILRKGGTVILSVPSIFDSGYSYSEKKRIKTLLRSKVYHVCGNKYVLDLFTREEVQGMFRDSGFTLKAFDSLFIMQKPRWGNWEPLSLWEKIKTKLDRLFPKEYGCIYYFVFKKP